MITPTDFLSSYSQCPVCGSTSREAIGDEKKTNRYLAALGRVTGHAPEQLLSQMKTFRCTPCESLYSDPWLNSETSSLVYQYGFSQHRYGWSRFNHFIEGDETDTTRNWEAVFSKIEIELSRLLPSITAYAEVACPFSGLLLHQARKMPVAERKRRWNDSIQGARQGKEFGRSFFDRFTNRGEANSPLNSAIANRYLLNMPSSLCWGTDCSLKGLNCKTASQTVLGVPVLTYDDAVRTGKSFDLIGFTNTLDHFFSPIEELKKCLRISKAILVITHGPDQLNKQHLYVFGRKVPTIFKGFCSEVYDLSEKTLAGALLKSERVYLLIR